MLLTATELGFSINTVISSGVSTINRLESIIISINSGYGMKSSLKVKLASIKRDIFGFSSKINLFL